MNSLIISFLYNIIIKVYQSLEGSKLWTFFGKVHKAFSLAFANSGVVNFLKRKGSVSYEDTSLVCKVLRIPLGFLSAVSKLASPAIRYITDKSKAGKYFKGYMSGFLALNTRFFCLMIMFGALTAFAINLFVGEFSLLLLVISVPAFFATFIKPIRIADFIDDSVLIKGVKRALGFEKYSFCVYEPQSSYYVYYSAVVIGIITGVVGCVNSLLFVLPAALAAAGAILLNPVCGICFAVFIAPILPTMALVGVCVLTIMSALCRKAYIGEFGIKMGRCGLCLMLFLLIATISTAFSASLLGSVGVWGMYIIFICFYYIIRDQIRKESTLTAILKLFSLGAAVVSVYGILQYVFKWNTQNAWIDMDMFEEATMRAYSTLANPNVLGEYLILALPVITWVLLNYTTSKVEKFVYSIIDVASFVCLILTQSRGCWIGCLLSAAVFISYYKSAIWKVVPFLILIVPFILPETIINRFTSVGDLSDSSTSYRVFIWLGTLLMLKDYWLGGIGLGEGAFRSVYPNYSYNGIVAPHSHNLYLQLIVESGIIGLLVFVIAMCIFYKDMINIQLRGRKFGVGAAALMSGVSGFLVQSMFDYTFYNYRVMCIFFMILAIGGTITTMSSKIESDKQL